MSWLAGLRRGRPKRAYSPGQAGLTFLASFGLLLFCLLGFPPRSEARLLSGVVRTRLGFVILTRVAVEEQNGLSVLGHSNLPSSIISTTPSPTAMLYKLEALSKAERIHRRVLEIASLFLILWAALRVLIKDKSHDD